MNSSMKNRLGSLTSIKSGILAILLGAVFSSQALANRPAMDDADSTPMRPQTGNTSGAGNRPQSGLSDETPEPQTEAPSAVELMMQEQSVTKTGDVVQLPAKEIQPGETLKIKLLDYPRRGMSMNKVQHEYGQPITISDSVGTPPITRWTYNDRVVYFEYSTVIHVVAR